MAFDPNPLLVGMVVLLGPIMFLGFALRWVAEFLTDGRPDTADYD